MKLQRISFKNFGIIRDQVMEDIHPGLVIIAGPNRAGKTTLMTALRYLGYGLPKTDIIPSPMAGQHDYNADVELPDQSCYNIHILGNSKPKVSLINGQRDMEVGEIFNNLDELTYRQVFTISLDELKQIPKNLSTKEEKYLQVALLGGGWVDALHLTKFKEEFRKKAEDIGATRGDKNVKKFKPYTKEIREGIDERNEANEQLEAYLTKKRELTELKNETIPLTENKIKSLQTELETLEIIRDHYDRYEKMLLLGENLKQNHRLLSDYPENGFNEGTRLKKEYDDCVDKYKQSFKKYSDVTETDDLSMFLEQKDTLINYQRNLSGWKEKVLCYQKDKQDHIDEEKILKQKLVQLNAKWDENLSILDDITADTINKENLRETVDKYRETERKLEQVLSEETQTKDKLDKKQEEKGQFIKKDKDRPISLPVIMGSGLMLILLIAVFNPPASLAAGFVLAVSIYVYFQSHQLKEKELENQLISIKGEIKGFRDKLISLKSDKKSLEKILDTTKNKMDQTIKLLGLPSNTPYSMLTDFYGEIINLKERYNIWEENKESLETQHEELEKIFSETISVLNSLDQNIPDMDADFSVSEEVFTAVETTVGYLELAQELRETEINKKELQEEITALLQEEKPDLKISSDISPAELSEMLDSFIERGRNYEDLRNKKETYDNLSLELETTLNFEKRKKILLGNRREGDVLSAYDQHFNGYSSPAEVERKYDEITEDMARLGQQRDLELENKTQLEIKIENLSSDEKLQSAHQKIIGAKNKLETLAEQYATYRLAEFMIDGVHKTFIENTKGTVLGKAGNIFKEITSGDYEKIDIPETNPGFNFKARRKNREGLMPTHQLSRATKEQLFLSVRLSRINSMKPLPIIFDDSLVNFDPRHSRQTAKLIAKLAKTHQVFVLTCHPGFINCLREHDQSAQCWGLDNGKINGPFDTFDEVSKLLGS